jgi:hypothetical protein
MEKDIAAIHLSTIIKVSCDKGVCKTPSGYVKNAKAPKMAVKTNLIFASPL